MIITMNNTLSRAKSVIVELDNLMYVGFNFTWIAYIQLVPCRPEREVMHVKKSLLRIVNNYYKNAVQFTPFC